MQSRRDARNLASRLGQLGQAVKYLQKNRADVLERIVRVAAAQGIDLLLRRLQHILRTARALINRVEDVRRSLRQTAEQGLIPHDLRILLDVRSRGRDLHELHDVFGRILLVIDAALAHFVEHGDGVDDLRIAEHLVDRLVDVAVGLQIEVVGAHHADDVIDAAAVNQH